jgi:tRNA threonylcarbamoyladenosine biosynthesis protein TsaB
MKEFILNIDCATEFAKVSLAEDGMLIQTLSCDQQKEHARFVHQAIETIIHTQQITLNELSAVAVTIGPGSYTGLRVGLASAKGICFALDKPLITISSLELLACDIVMHHESKNALICPMIDARRMEVFTAIYNRGLNEITKPHALILDMESFKNELSEYPVIFTGNGSEKFKAICKHQHAIFLDAPKPEVSMCSLSYNYYKSLRFSDLIISEPQYIKAYKAF